MTVFFAILAAAFVIGIVRFIIHMPESIAKDFRTIAEQEERAEMRRLAAMTEDQKIEYQKQKAIEKQNRMEAKKAVQKHKVPIFLSIGLFIIGFVIIMTTEYYIATFVIWLIAACVSMSMAIKQKINN